LIRIRALAGEQVEIQANSEGHLERGAHDLWGCASSEAGDLLGQHRPFSRQTLQLLPHAIQLTLQLLQ